MASDPQPIEPSTDPALTESTLTDSTVIDAGPTEPARAEPARAESAAAQAPQAPAADAPPILAAGAGSGEPIVVMHGVSRRFDDREVLSGIDLIVPRGTILGIIGPSGAGKTTTIRMLTGAIRPTSGEVSVMGRDPRLFRRREREKIGYMPQSFALYEDLTAGENIDFVASLFGMLWRRRRRRSRFR